MVMVLPNTISSKPESPSPCCHRGGAGVPDQHCSLSNPFQPWVGGAIQSGRTLARHHLLSLAIQLYIFLALPETMPYQVQGPSFSPSAGKIFN